MNCSKCIHNPMCKFQDMLPEIQEKYPFIEDFSCKYNEKAAKPSKEEKATSPSKISALEEKSTQVIEEVPVKKERKKRTPRVPVTKVETSFVENEDDEELSFSELEVAKLPFNTPTIKSLTHFGCVKVKDIYDIDKQKLPKAIIEDINAKLSAFNQPMI